MFEALAVVGFVGALWLIQRHRALQRDLASLRSSVAAHDQRLEFLVLAPRGDAAASCDLGAVLEAPRLKGVSFDSTFESLQTSASIGGQVGERRLEMHDIVFFEGTWSANLTFSLGRLHEIFLFRTPGEVGPDDSLTLGLVDWLKKRVGDEPRRPGLSFPAGSLGRTQVAEWRDGYVRVAVGTFGGILSLSIRWCDEPVNEAVPGLTKFFRSAGARAEMDRL